MAYGFVTKLLLQIEENTKKYLDYIKSQQLPEPNFEQGDNLDPRNPLPSEIAAAKDAALESTKELHYLLLGPLGLLLSSPGEVRIVTPSAQGFSSSN